MTGVLVVAALTAQLQLVFPDVIAGGTGRYPLPIYLPLVPAIVLSLLTVSPNPFLEVLSCRNMGLMRLLHAGLLIAVATVALLPYASYPIFVATFRNLLGFCGLSLLGAFCFGHERGWALPVALALIGTLFARTGTSIANWAWYLQPNTAVDSWMFAGALFILGFSLLVLPTHRWFDLALKEEV